MDDRDSINGRPHGRNEVSAATDQSLTQENSYSTADESTLRDAEAAKSSFDSSTNATEDGFKPQSESRTRSWKKKLLRFRFVKTIALFVDPDFIDALEHEKPPPRVWRTNFIRFGPLSGIAAMVAAIVSLTASLGILAGSDGQPVSHWSATPSTFLAIFTAVANLSMRYAAVQGVVIAWWSRATSGTTLAKLHWDWRAGTTLRGALTAGRHMGLLGLACVFSTLVVADGPFLQRSSTVISAPIHDQALPLNISVLPDLRIKRFGSWSANNPFNLEQAFNTTVPTNHGRIPNNIAAYNWPNNLRAEKSWYTSEDLVGVVEGCKGQCELKLRTLALFPTSCKTHTQPVYYKGTYDHNAVLLGEQAPPFDSLGLVISINMDVSGEREKINLITGYSTVQDCSGVLNYTICSLEAGIGDYDVQVENNKIKMNSLGTPELVSLLDNPVNRTYNQYITGHLSTLAPVVVLLDNWYSGMICYYKTKEWVDSIWGGSHLTLDTYQDPYTVNAACPSYQDPHEDVMKSLTRLIVYMAAYTNGLHSKALYPQHNLDEDLAVKSEVMAYRTGNQNVYHTEYKFFVAAAVIELVCIALVVPTYWGWWKLGRPVSFSPLETAKAFESPTFAAYNSNSPGRDLAKSAGSIQVRYGSKSTGLADEGEKLAFADPDEICVPRNGSRFDS